MEIKNTTPMTYKAVTAFLSQNNASDKKTLILLTVLMILSAIPAVRGLLSIARGWGDLVTYLVVICTSIVTLGCAILMLLPKITAWRIASRKLVFTFTFTQDGYTYGEQGREPTPRTYDAILRVTESPDYYFLYIAEKQAQLVAKNGFTEGTERDFRILLHTVIDPKKLHIQ